MSAKRQVVCQHCDSVIGVPDDKLGDGPRCPKCRTPLFEGHPVTLTEANFDRHIAKSGLPVVVDFWAPWCGPCRMMAPAFEDAARSMEPTARFAKLNTDEAQGVAARFQIRSIPTLIVFRDGREVARQSGALSAGQLARWVSSTVD